MSEDYRSPYREVGIETPARRSPLIAVKMRRQGVGHYWRKGSCCHCGIERADATSIKCRFA